MEMRGIAGENDDATRRIGLQLIGVELIAQADVEDAGDDCVDTILRMAGKRHQLHAVRYPDP